MLLAVIVAAVAGGCAGWGVRAWLRRGSWRLEEEAGARLSRVWWEPAAVGVLWPFLLWRLDQGGQLAAWPAVAVAVLVGVALTAIDVAVHRLPDLLTLGCLPVIGLLLLLASVLQGDWHGFVTAAWAVGVGVPIYLLLGLGGLGLGDVKLSLMLLLTLGWFGTATALAGAMLGFIFGGLWAAVLMLSHRATRRSHFAYGPWMLVGALVALAAQPA